MKTKLISWVVGAVVASSSLALMASPANADHDSGKGHWRGSDRSWSSYRERGHDNDRRDSDHRDSDHRDFGGWNNRGWNSRGWNRDDRSSDRGSSFSFSIKIGDLSRPVSAICAPPTPVYYAPPPRRVWVPAHYEERQVQVCVEPARIERRYTPPVIQRRFDDCGRPYELVVRPGTWCDVRVPARYETRCEQVLVPGHWEEADCR
ncbi:MAG: hypothetical protein IT444_11530 [Phycisphaeraceae bacterium]|nr:hypothetical protein [Phycisphaeraceae bacterium]